MFTMTTAETAPPSVPAREFAVLLNRRASVEAALVALAKRAARKNSVMNIWFWCPVVLAGLAPFVWILSHRRTP